MTAINNLVQKADAVQRNSLQILDAAINELAKESTIQTLIDIVLDLQHQLSDLILFHIAFELPVAEGKAEVPEKDYGEPHTHEISDYVINIGPLNSYSLAGVLTDTISEFETQTEVITSSFTPFTLSDTSRIVTADIGRLQPFTGSEQPGTPFLPSDRTFFFETLYAELADSAFLLHELETIRSRMERVPVEKRSEDIRETVPDTPVHAVQTLPRSGIFKESEAFSQYADLFARIAHDISATVQTGVLKASEATEISLLETIAIEALSALEFSSEVASEVARSSAAFTTELSSVKEATEISTMKGIAATLPAAASAPTVEPHSEGIPGQRMIEIPAFTLHTKIQTSEKESAVNAVALSEAMSQGFPLEKKTASRHIHTPSLMEIYNLPSSSASVSRAFETISSYITTATALDNQITEMIGKGEENMFTQHSLADLLTAGEETVTPLFLTRTVSEQNGGPTGVEPTGLAATLSLIQEGAAAVNDSFLAASYTQEYRALPVAALPRAMENGMLRYGSPQETISGMPGESRNHFQNTFNITIDMKGSGEEHELRELGKKIGAILSEEIKRYGVIR